MFINEKFHPNDTLQLFMDSAQSLGYGAVYATFWFYGPFPSHWKTLTFLELYRIVLVAHIWATIWKNHSILFFMDNLALFSIINSQTSRDPHIIKLLRVLILSCMQNNIFFQARHINGSKNVLVDFLSRLQVEKFRQLSPTSRPQPEQIPPRLLPENFLNTSHNC